MNSSGIPVGACAPRVRLSVEKRAVPYNITSYATDVVARIFLNSVSGLKAFNFIDWLAPCRTPRRVFRGQYDRQIPARYFSGAWRCCRSIATAEPITLKLSYFSSDRTVGYLAGIKPFVDAVNDEANGLLHIKVYFSGALGKDQSKTAQSVLDGTTDMAFVVPGLAPNLFSDDKVMEMPGLFRDTREASLVFTRLIAAGALRGYEKFFVIEAIASAPETIHTRSPVASLKDLIGKKIGINNETQGTALEKLGMRPVFLPATDAAMAISSGKIDGVAKSPSILFDFGITRFATYHYLLGTSVVPLALLMSRKKFDSLPEQAQAIDPKV